MSLFVTELAFGEEEIGTAARLGVLVASLAAAVTGVLIMIPGRIESDHSMDENLPEHATVG